MRLARTTGTGAGLLVLILGLWAGFIPFVGPYFHYGFGPDATWHYTVQRLWLDILPAAAAVLGGLMLIGSGRRASGTLGGWLALCGGVWLLVGPSFSMLWQHPPAGVLQSGIGVPLGGHDRAAAEMIGAFYGVGALITMLSAFAIGRFTPARLVAAPGAPAAEEPGEAPPRRRGLIRRRRGTVPSERAGARHL
ncbi:MAG TPA: hypothetical protein VIC05_09165 [Solirubrobacteraceae bacterium]|jgi:hypothetical protein